MAASMIDRKRFTLGPCLIQELFCASRSVALEDSLSTSCEMDDDSDGRAQVMDGSSRAAEVMDEPNERALVKGEPTEQAQVPGDSSRQGEMTGDSIKKAPLANHNSYSGGSEPFAFWRHVPPPTLYFMPTYGPYSYYGGVTPPPYGVFPPLWNGTRSDIWSADTRQAAVDVQLTPPTEEVNYPKQHIHHFGTEAHYSTPMEISPCASPLEPSTTAPTEREAPAPAVKAESATGFACEVNRNQAVKTPSLEKRTPMPRALKPVRYHHADPGTAESSPLSLLKRCKSCISKMARANRQSATYAAEECTCTQKFVPAKVQGENTASTAKTETGLEELGPLTANAKSRAVRQYSVVTGADRPAGSGEPSIASMKWRQSADCISGSAAKLNDETRSSSALCTDSGPVQSAVHFIPVVEGRRKEQNSWHHHPATSRNAPIENCLGTNNGETFSHHSHRHISAEYFVNRFVEEIRAASEQKSCASDPRVTVKIAGAYFPGPKVDNLQTAVIDIKMDPLLGACVEHAEGPFLLPSELEQDDEGWLWTFE
ncbi:uncharacterized protein [Dermacentor albipictus]|uniref:uncharacterized protein isoform X2 n=1 Tax=Dermacentor albipictus TaxID=60249 RepID=UPI0031FE00D1